MDRSELKQRIKNSLWIYHDYAKGVDTKYLRFVPLETPQFRHGISFGVTIGADDDAAKDAVADYLVDSFLCLVEEK